MALLALFGAAAFAPELAEPPCWMLVRLLFTGGAVLLASSWRLALRQKKHFEEIAPPEARDAQIDVDPI